MIRPLLSVLALALSAAASAATVGVRVEVAEGGPVGEDEVAATVWHAAALSGGHQPVVVDRALPESDVLALLRDEGATALLDVDVTWGSEARATAEGNILMLPVPKVQMVDLAFDGASLREVARGAGEEGAGVVEFGQQVLFVPEVAIQGALDEALASLSVPAWGPRQAVRMLPIVIAADAAWKVRHGARWREAVMARVGLASRLLAPIGIRLEVVGESEWAAPLEMSSLSARLRHLADQPRTGSSAALRVGFTGAGGPQGPGLVEEVGRAFEPGHDLVVVDQRGLGADSPEHWDVAREAIALAHETLHALGVPHDEAEGTLMSSRHAGVVQQLSEASQALARAAVQARVAHWDSTSAILVLADAAERWMVGQPSQQLSYVVGNLERAPEPGSLAPGTTRPLVDAALTRIYLDLASASPERAATHHAAARLHAGALLGRSGWLSEQLQDAAPLLGLLPSADSAGVAGAAICDPALED